MRDRLRGVMTEDYGRDRHHDHDVEKALTPYLSKKSDIALLKFKCASQYSWPL